MILVASALVATAAECPAPATPADLDRTLAAAEDAFAALDVERFHRSVDEATLVVPCLDALVTPSLAARYHRVTGLRDLVSRRREEALAAFVAARTLEPGWTPPAELLPDGHAARVAWEGTQPSAATTAIPLPQPGTLWLDGLESLARPADRPTIAQVTDDVGGIRASAWILPADPLPPYPLAPTPTPAPAPAPIPTPTPAPSVDAKRKAPVAWLVTAGVSTLVAGGLYAGAVTTAASFRDPVPGVPFDDLRRQRATTNRLVIASGVVGAVAAGSLVGAAASGL